VCGCIRAVSGSSRARWVPHSRARASRGAQGQGSDDV
jgi:hypothetical protein